MSRIILMKLGKTIVKFIDILRSIGGKQMLWESSAGVLQFLAFESNLLHSPKSPND